MTFEYSFDETFLQAKYNRGGNLGEQFGSDDQVGLRHVTGTYY